MTRPHPSRSRLRPQIAEQVGERGFESVLVFPVREVGDVVFANLFVEVFASISVIAAPVADVVDARQSDRKQLLPLLDPFRRAGASDFSPPPFAVHVVLRKHQQRAVVELGGRFYVAVIAPRDRLIASQSVDKRSLRHAERDGYVKTKLRPAQQVCFADFNASELVSDLASLKDEDSVGVCEKQFRFG